MPKAIFETIYKDLKRKIEAGEYPAQTMLPSEHELITIYNCSRNTIRRSLAILAADGYVQSVHGKGVYVIYQPIKQAAFTMGGIESFRESAERNRLKAKTNVINFTEIIADEHLAEKTGFPVGAELYYIQRVRILDGKALILDINLFLKSVVGELTKKVAEKSIYDYLEKECGISIITSKRRMTVEHVTEMDEKYLDLNLEDYNCLAIVTSQAYNSDGIMFEYTQSRHRPDYFSFQDTATRRISVF